MADPMVRRRPHPRTFRPKPVPSVWNNFGHLTPYRLNNSKQGVARCKRDGKHRMDLDVQVCWKDAAARKANRPEGRVCINAHWATIGENGMVDPQGKFGPKTRLDDLTLVQVRRLRGKKPYETRIATMAEMFAYCASLNMTVEAELKGHIALTRTVVLNQLYLDAKAAKCRVQVKTLDEIAGAGERCQAAYTVGFIVILLVRRGKNPKKWCQWLDYYRGQKPQWV